MITIIKVHSDPRMVKFISGWSWCLAVFTSRQQSCSSFCLTLMSAGGRVESGEHMGSEVCIRGVSEYLGICWNAWLQIRLEDLLYMLDGFLMAVQWKSKHLGRKLFPQNLCWHGVTAVGLNFDVPRYLQLWFQMRTSSQPSSLGKSYLD